MPKRLLGLALASRTVVGAAAGHHDATDGRSADQAGLSGAHIHEVPELKKTALAGSIHVIGDRGAAKADGFAQNFLDRPVEAIQFD